MDRRAALVAVSAAQLAAGVAGQVLAIKRRLAFDIAIIQWRGRPERIAHDMWLLGTGLSAPVTMLATQAAATATLLSRPDARAQRVLGVLGAMMLGGYLVEGAFRNAVRPRGWDAAVTPVAIAGAGLSAVMAALGLPGGPAARAPYAVRSRPSDS